MPWQSHGSVKVRFLDGPKVIQKLREIALGLIEQDPRVVEVRLFGSLAKGNYTPRSDADICIILRGDDPRRISDRTPEFRGPFLASPVPVDLLVYTRSEIEQIRQEGRQFAWELLERGMTLAAA